VKGLTMMGFALLDVRTTTSTMAWATFDFIINLNKPYWASKSQINKITRTIRAKLSSLKYTVVHDTCNLKKPKIKT
jgi:hypothetical protein